MRTINFIPNQQPINNNNYIQTTQNNDAINKKIPMQKPI